MTRRFNSLCALLPLTVLMSACTTDSDESVTPVTDTDAGTGFVATFKPDLGLMPFPTDVWRNGSTDGTLNIYAGNPAFDSDPLIGQVEQMNLLDGFGLNSAIHADFSDPVDESSLEYGENVFVFRVKVGGVDVAPTLVTTFDVGTANFQGGRSVVELNPTAPLDPLTTYAVILTDGIQSADGTDASADTDFQTMVDAFPAANTGAGAGSTVEALYDAMVRDLLGLAELTGIGAANVVNTWVFTTQSVGDSLALIDAMATARTNAFVPLGMTTADLNAQLAGKADVYAGVIELPYYLDPANPLTSYWEAVEASCQIAIDNDLIETASASTTAFCPLPEEQAAVRVPVLMTVPNATSATGGAIFGVVVFQHGITQDRTNALAVADTLADTGHVVIAIDLPLHGITDTENALFASDENPLYAATTLEGVTEQTFNLDIDGEAGIDPSGEYFINLESPITARDALRQAAANLIHLVATIPTIDYNGGGADFPGTPIRFVGHSLGGITGATFLGVDTTVDAAVLVAPGGDIADLILGSDSIYPEVEAGLAEEGLVAGMRLFDDFFRNAQTLIEGGDPVNYAAAANANHNVLMMEMVGGAGVDADLVVPNTSTDRLADAMGLDVVTTTTVDIVDGVDGLVQFVVGDHGSILSPAASADATVEMQTQMAVFIGGHPAIPAPAGGRAILISNPDVIAD